MEDCAKCGGLGIICNSHGNCLDVTCKDCGHIVECPVCKAVKESKTRDPKVLQLVRKERE